MRRAIQQTLYAFLVAPIIGGPIWAAPSVDDFRYFLQMADCAFLETDHAIDLWVFDRKFPLATGYFFAGRELEGVTFRKNPDLGPLEYSDRNPDTSPGEVISILSAQSASVTYYRVQETEELSDPEYSDFEPFEWNGLSLLYRSSDGGRQVESTVHQVVVRHEGDLERLLITATNPLQIARIVGCAKEID